MKSVLTGVLNRLLLLFVDEVRFGFEVHLILQRSDLFSGT